MSEKKTLFDTLYEGAKDVIKAMQKPLVRKNIKRKLRAAYDSAQAEIDANTLSTHEELMKVSDCDVNHILKLKGVSRTRVEQQEDIAATWKELFDKDFDPNVE